MKNKLFLYLLTLLVITSFYTGCSYLPYGNKAPMIDSMPLTSIKVEQPYSYDANANDFENDVLTYSLIDYPEGMTIDTLTGVVNWTSTKEQVGEHKVVINVEDRWRNDTQNFTIEVSNILLTSIEVLPSAMRLAREDSNMLSFNFLTVTANYDYGPTKSVSLADCVYTSSDSNIATVGHTGVISGVHPGSATITVSYTKNGIKKSDSMEVIVSELPVGDS